MAQVKVPTGHKFRVFYEAACALDRAQVPYLVGGGLAVRVYGRVRESKDMDLFLDSRQVFPALDTLSEAGFHTRETDASWLYKALKEGVLVDIIVRTSGDVRLGPETFRHGRRVLIEGYPFPVMGPEDTLVRKIFSEQEGRPDWYDALSMLAAPIPDFDWNYFLQLALTYGPKRSLSLLLFAQSVHGDKVVPGDVVARLCSALAAPIS